MTWPDGAPAVMHPVTEASYRILRSRIDFSRLPKFSRDVTERVIHASADFDYFTDLVCDEDSLAEAVAALAAGAPVVADAAMVAAGITASPVLCKVDEPLTLPAGQDGVDQQGRGRCPARVRGDRSGGGLGCRRRSGRACRDTQPPGRAGVRGRLSGRFRRRCRGKGRASSERHPVGEQRLREGRPGRCRRGIQCVAQQRARVGGVARGLGDRSGRPRWLTTMARCGDRTPAAARRRRVARFGVGHGRRMPPSAGPSATARACEWPGSAT